MQALMTLTKTDKAISDEYKAFLQNDHFPCYAAQAALNQEQVHTLVVPDMRDYSMIPHVLHALHDYIDLLRDTKHGFRSLALIFKNTIIGDEDEFEDLFWDYLRALYLTDRMYFPHDKRVSADPTKSNYSFSIKGEALFLVGLHPKNQRQSRRFAYPTIVFNSHQQFEELRESGKFEKLRDSIRARDKAMNGSVNPMLNDYGEGLAVKQYTGKEYDSSCKCPFQH